LIQYWACFDSDSFWDVSWAWDFFSSLLELRDEAPKTPVGKISKKDLREHEAHAHAGWAPRTLAMMEMPPLQFAQANGVRLAFYDAGPRDDPTPFVLCHGFTEIGFTWRRQTRDWATPVFAPSRSLDQRGYGASDRPPEVEDHSIDLWSATSSESSTILGSTRRSSSATTGVAMSCGRRPRAIRTGSPASAREARACRSHCDASCEIRRSHVYCPVPDSREPDRILAENVDKVFDALLRGPLPGEETGGAGPGAEQDFVGLVQAYDPAGDTRAPIMSEEERQVFVEAFRRSGFTGGINWYRNITRNWENAAGRDRTIKASALMITAELDPTQLPPSGMDALVPSLTKHLVRSCGHWTQEEKPDEVNAAIVAWRRRVLGQ
jgi:pimeloyl-ACP methyl ester carboxylesterase